MKKFSLLMFSLSALLSVSQAHAACSPSFVSVSVGSFNVDLGKTCNNDDSVSYLIETTSAKGKIVHVSQSDTDALSSNNISAVEWNTCLSKANTTGLSDAQRGAVEIAAMVADDSEATLDDAKSSLAQVCSSTSP